ncbi:amidase [Polyangium mundeleinium]|uniref:Amidase family protein n=1 Tax=Polyangium mundeleinium TaxID=2995306 RepID=A0ABT5EST8_9BACT|nr:amidase family protein [Polyangium mundeleinium]MDC0743845.1 amidase family protein [Polyangium mundeleinium]
MSFKEYDDHDALGLAALVKKGEVSPAELLEEAITRAERVNGRLNAIVIGMHVIARERARGELPDGPFRGVPFLMKDMATAYAGVPLQAASRLFRGNVPAHHAELTERFLRAGLVVFGKTNSPEFGILPTTEPELYGPTHNPWRLGYSPGGSSGGAAAAIAAGIVPMAHGGDGGGSIRIPASCCGLFGFKPTRARNPVGPDVSESFYGFAAEHVLSRTVRDSAAALDATAGPEATAMYHAPAPYQGFLAALDTPPEKLRIAFTSDPLLHGAEPHPDNRRAVEETAKLLEKLGHHVEPARPSFEARDFAKGFFLHFSALVASEIRAAEAFLGRPAKREDVERTTWLLNLVGRSTDAGTFVYYRRKLFEVQRAIAGFFQDYDVLLTPTIGRPPVPHGTLLAKGLEEGMQELVARLDRPELLRLPRLLDMAVDRAYAFSPFTPVFNVTGQPSASVPLHWNADGLPIGTMLTARFGEDARLFRLCAQIEEVQSFRARRAPVHAAASAGLA